MFEAMQTQVSFQGSQEKVLIAWQLQSLLHVSARGNERRHRYYIGKRHTSLPAPPRATIATVPREPILVGRIRSSDERKGKRPRGPASYVFMPVEP